MYTCCSFSPRDWQLSSGMRWVGTIHRTILLSGHNKYFQLQDLQHSTNCNVLSAALVSESVHQHRTTVGCCNKKSKYFGLSCWHLKFSRFQQNEDITRNCAKIKGCAKIRGSLVFCWFLHLRTTYQWYDKIVSRSCHPSDLIYVLTQP